MRRRYGFYIALVLVAGLSFGVARLASAFSSATDVSALRRVSLSDWTQFEEVSRGSQGRLSIAFGDGYRVRVEDWYPTYDAVRNALQRQETPEVVLLVDDAGLLLGSEGRADLAASTAEVDKARRNDGLFTGTVLILASLIGALWIYRRGVRQA